MRPGVSYLAGGVAGLAIGSLAMLALIPSQHTSSAVLESRAGLTNLILTHNLYGERRQIEPMDDTVEHMREHIRLSQSADRVTLAFTHPDPAVAQRITLNLTTRLVEEFNREKRNQNAIWIQTWADASEIAANSWSQAAELSRTQSSPRAAYDVELAKQHYAAMKEKLAEAKIEAMLLKRQLGPRVEIRDPGFLPSTHAILWPLPLTGVLLGLFATALLRGFR